LAPHFVDAVLRQHPKLRGGIVETTLDLELQRHAEKALELHLGKLAPRGVSHGAIVILDTRNGAVRAMVGSRDYLAAGDGQINGAMIHRSCGSTLKPFLYLRAIDERLLTAASLLPDTPDAVRAEYIDYDPVNYDKRFWGPVRVREALGNSLNVPAVVTLSRIGARRVFLALEECGLKFARPFSEYGAGLILGNAEVRLLDLTAAYTIFAGHSLAIEPRFLSSTPVRHRYIATPGAAAIVADILADNSARQKTFGAFSPLAFENHRIPCKTGTSSGFRDAWTVGVTNEHAVGVWVGNFDGRPMEEIAAVTGTAPLWREIIEHLLWRGDTSVLAPETLAELTTREVCRLTGLRPTSASPGVIKEWFQRGTEPLADASRYFREIGGVTRLILPPEYALWCRSLQNHLHAEPDSNSKFRIISPAPNATFLIDPHLPSSQQALPLIAAGGSAEELVWTVDGKRVEPSNGRHFWRIVQGRHTVEVASPTDRASVECSVE
jgi:penicillin-binding protein 1C